MDLIKREDAIKVTWQEPSYTDAINALTEVRERIKDIPSAEPKTHMTEDDAFHIVFKDLTKDEGLFTGRYDAKHGSEKYMYGINSVMEYIAYKVGGDCYEAFSDRFIKNMIESQDKAERSIQ